MSATGTMGVIAEYLDALLDGTSSAPPVANAWQDNGDHVDVAAAVCLPSANVAGPASSPTSPATALLAASPEPQPPPAPMPAPRVLALPATVAPVLAVPVQDVAPPATSVPITVAQNHRWLRVAVGRDSYALELLRVQEVVRLAPIVALRGAAHAVLGVMNLRGRIVPVFDLGLWLGCGCVQPDERSRIVVVERDDELIGVLISAVEDVVTLGRDRIEPPLAGRDPGAIVGIARVGPAPTVLLDANALFG